MQTPEEIFLRDLEAFFYNNVEFNDLIRRRIASLLMEYKKSINVETRYVTKSFVIYKTTAGTQVMPNSNKKLLDIPGMQVEFDRFCKENSIIFESIKRRGRSTKAITKVRTDFCNYVAVNFLVSKSELAAFFGLNHATIHYYFNPKNKVEEE